VQAQCYFTKEHRKGKVELMLKKTFFDIKREHSIAVYNLANYFQKIFS